jgi:predicted secreted hydrolase
MRASRLLAALLGTQLWFASGCEPAVKTDRGTGLDVLAQSADGYAQAKPGRSLNFPADHGPHPDYRIEWWYLTANLQDRSGQRYGAQWTLFRLAVKPPASPESRLTAQNNQVYMAHMAITTPSDHLSFQRYARGGKPGGAARAGVTIEPFSAWLDDWSLHSTGDDWLPLQVRARQGNNWMDLRLQSTSPLVLQGDAGFSAKSTDGGGSYYYSQPFLEASGHLTVAGRDTPVSGKAWLDREWSSQFLQRGQTGWDWFSLHLDSGEKLMLFQVRGPDDPRSGNFLQGKLMAADGSSTELDPGRIELLPLKNTRVEGRNLPLHWRISLPQIDREFEVQALVEDQWMDVDFPYWEGAVIVSGSGPGNSGEGYMELTGYPIENPTGP